MLECRSPNRTISGHVTAAAAVGLGVGFWNIRRLRRDVTFLMTLFAMLVNICSAAPHSTFVAQSQITSSAADDIRLFGVPIDLDRPVSAVATVATVFNDSAVEADVKMSVHLDRLPRRSSFSRSSLDGAQRRASVSSKVTISRIYRLYSRCSNKYLRVAGRHIDALGAPDDNYAQLEFITDNFDSRLRIRSVQSRDFICFNRKGRLIVKTSGSDQHCVFRELNSADDFTELVSVVNSRWYLGFDRNGRRLNASVSESSQPPHTSPVAVTLSTTTSRPTEGLPAPYPSQRNRSMSGKTNRTSSKSPSLKSSSTPSFVTSSRRRSRSTVRPVTAPSTATPPPTTTSTAATSTSRPVDHPRHLRHSRHRQIQQQLLLEQQEQLRHRVRHHHKQQRRRQCFQFVKTEISTATPILLPALVEGRYVMVDARRSHGSSQIGVVDTGRESSASKPSPSADEDDSVSPSMARSGVDGQHPHHRYQGPPVNFGKVYTNLGVISLNPPFPDIGPGDPVDPT